MAKHLTKTDSFFPGKHCYFIKFRFSQLHLADVFDETVLMHKSAASDELEFIGGELPPSKQLWKGFQLI